MKIDITGSDLQIFIALAQRFPSGKIIAEKDKAYWEFDGQAQVTQQPVPGIAEPQKKGNAFFNMFDELANRI